MSVGGKLFEEDAGGVGMSCELVNRSDRCKEWKSLLRQVRSSHVSMFFHHAFDYFNGSDVEHVNT